MSAYIDAARGWIGTPYLHQGTKRGAGCDCLGLVRGVWAQVSGDPLVQVAVYTADWSEPQGDEVLLRTASALLVAKERDDVARGDVLMFRMRHGAVAKHMGLQAETGECPTFIHAYQGHGVLENAFSRPWQRRLVARFAFPDNA